MLTRATCLGKSPFIVQLYGEYYDQPSDVPRGMVMESLEGDVHSLLKNGNITWELKIQICNDAAEAVSCLHSLNILHRDIKPANLLLQDGNRAKLCDFEFSCETKNAAGSKGSYSYVAPEIFNKKSAGVPKSDIYSTIITFMFVITQNEPPYLPAENLFFNLSEASKEAHLNINLDGPSPLIIEFIKDIIRSCWGMDPNSRLSAQEITDIFKNENVKNNRMLPPPPAPAPQLVI